jgi:hypothetical protein
MLAVGFEPTVWAGDRPQTYASDLAATAGTGMHVVCNIILGRVRLTIFAVEKKKV